MRVSIIIPNYNHAAYIEKRIETVLNQTFTDFELIILDDHSTDNSAAIIDKYRNHPKVAHIVYNEINSGSTFKQWEKGVALAKGEYLWIAESDDYANKHFLAIAMQRLQGNTSTGLYFCNYHSINERGGIIPSNHTYPVEFVHYFGMHERMDGKYFCDHYLFFSCIILNASGVVFKKSLFTEANKSYMQLKVSGDWRMWVNICYNTNIFFDEKKLNYFRMHANNVRSAKAKLMGVEAVQNMIYFVRKTPNKSVQQKLKNSICKTWVYSFYLNKDLVLNTRLLKDILSVDILFPFRLLKRVTNKLSKAKA